MSKTSDAQFLSISRPRAWGKPNLNSSLKPPYYGLDTERNTEHDCGRPNCYARPRCDLPAGPAYGKFVCGFAYGDMGEIEFNTFDDLPSGTYWVWNLAYDVEGMLRDVADELGWQARQDGTRFTLANGARCIYYKGKRFEYYHNKVRRVFLEASSFYGRVSLAKAAGKFIGESKGDIDGSKMSLSRYEGDSEYRAAVRTYCIQDAKLCYELMNYFDAGLRGIPDGRLPLCATPGAVARRMLGRLGQFPESLWISNRLFLWAYCGGKFESYKWGIFDYKSEPGKYIYKHDIKSAYPWALSQLPLLSSKSYVRAAYGFSDNALYGAYEVAGKLDTYVGLFPGWNKATRVFTNAAERCWLTKPEVDWAIAHGADLKLLRGIEIFDPAPNWDAFPKIVKPLFDLKENPPCAACGCPAKKKKEACPDCGDLRDSPAGQAGKIVVNSLYGDLVQLNPKAGKWVPHLEVQDLSQVVDIVGPYSLLRGAKSYEAGLCAAFAYGSTLTALTRLRIMDAAIEVGSENIISAHTDSVFTLRPLALRDEMGGWGLEQRGKRLMQHKTGVYAFDEKVAARGISPHSKEEKITEETLLQDRVPKKFRVSLNRAKTWADVSLIITDTAANNFGRDLKRDWLRDLDASVMRRGEWVDSRPLTRASTRARDVGTEVAAELAAVGL